MLLMETQKRKLVVGQWMKKDLCCCDSVERNQKVLKNTTARIFRT